MPGTLSALASHCTSLPSHTQHPVCFCFSLPSLIRNRRHSVFLLVHPSIVMARTSSYSLVVVAVVLLATVSCIHVTEAAKIETFNPASCNGSPTNTFYVNGNTCQTFNDQGAVRISDVSSGTRVSIHNQRSCEAASSVAQIYGPGCVVQGATKLRAVWIQG